MPEPAEPKGPGLLERLWHDRDVQSAVNTGIREIIRLKFGGGGRRRK